jgi:hypothetical protein
LSHWRKLGTGLEHAKIRDLGDLQKEQSLVVGTQLSTVVLSAVWTSAIHKPAVFFREWGQDDKEQRAEAPTVEQVQTFSDD